VGSRPGRPTGNLGPISPAILSYAPSISGRFQLAAIHPATSAVITKSCAAHQLAPSMRDRMSLIAPGAGAALKTSSTCAPYQQLAGREWQARCEADDLRRVYYRWVDGAVIYGSAS